MKNLFFILFLLFCSNFFGQIEKLEIKSNNFEIVFKTENFDVNDLSKIESFDPNHYRLIDEDRHVKIFKGEQYVLISIDAANKIMLKTELEAYKQFKEKLGINMSHGVKKEINLILDEKLHIVEIN